MSDANPYQTPESNLENLPPVNPQLNLDWDLGDVFKEAWQLTEGFKGTIICAGLIYLGVSHGLSLLITLIVGNEPFALVLLAQLVVMLISYPLGVGICMLGIKRSAGMPTNVNMLFDYYPKTIQIFLLYISMMILIFLGFLVFIIPGIYLAIAYSMAMPLLIEKNLGIWQALETSRKMIHKYWFNFFGLYIVISVIFFLSALPLGIGLIWSIPFCIVVFGIVYRSMFGVESVAVAQKSSASQSF